MPPPALRHALPILGAALLLAAAPALAEDLVEPHDRLIGGTWTVGRYYPIGLDQQVTMTFKQRIGDSNDLLFKTRSWQVSAMGGFNPANWTARVEAMVEPIAVFQLRAAYDARGFFGNFGAILSSNDPNQRIDDAEVTRATNANEDRPGIVQGITIEPALQAAVGPIVIRNTFGFEYASWSGSDLYVYDPGPDILRPANGWTLTETGTVGYLNGPLFAGAQYIWINPVGLRQEHKIAAIVAWTFYDRGAAHGWFNKPTLVGLAFFNLVHAGRPAFPPTVVLGLSTESDLLGGAIAPAPALKP